MTAIRKPAVSGTFYPADASTLRTAIGHYLKEADVRGLPPMPPKAIIAPHAGYIYSGPVAGRAYAALTPHREQIRRVVLIGPCHQVPVRGLALPQADSFETPLGPIAIDKDAASRIATLAQVQTFDATHAMEHSLEVHLPFLQVALGDFQLVPLVAGDATADEVAGVIDALWGGPETLIVISSDLSHYLDYDAATTLDAQTAHAIETFDGDAIGSEQACGRVPMRGLLTLARRRGLSVRRVDLRNSGDTAGPRDRVVGYGAWLFYEDPDTTGDLLETHGEALLKLAARSIRHGFDQRRALAVTVTDHAPELAALGASFVTLKRNGDLRGCIGTAEAHRPLVEDVAENGYGAAFRDPRFPPLAPAETDNLALSVSVLSPPRPLAFDGEADLLARLVPGRDGLVFEDAGRRGLFLPQVWDSLPDAKDFLRHLKQKAGFSADHWSDTVRILHFTAESVTSEAMIDPGLLWNVEQNPT